MWNTISTNKYLETRIKYQEHQKHKTSLSSVRTTLDNKQPYCPQFMRTKSKAKQQRNEELGDIFKKNQILLTKMLKIEQNPTKKLNADKLFSEYRTGHVAPESIQRQHFLKKIQQENDFLYKRMNTIQSNYSQKKWDDHKSSDIYRSNNISQNARRGICHDYNDAKSLSKSQQFFYDSHFSAQAQRKSMTELRSNNDLSREFRNNNNSSLSFKKQPRPMTASGSKSSLTNLDKMQFI